VVEELECGDWVAMVVTGKPYVFAAGADIEEFPTLRTHDEAVAGSRVGHELFGRIGALSYPRRDHAVPPGRGDRAHRNGDGIGYALEAARRVDERPFVRKAAAASALPTCRKPSKIALTNRPFRPT
jgi:hypothetical protein